jgi:NAD(P)-dependent dehydrogenase (short-subunit alcohol dehydrogenase family)
MQLEQKLIVITGAGRGIGRAMALAFAHKRSNLALLDLNQADLDRTRELCEVESVQCRTYLCNVAREEDVSNTLDSVVRDFGRLDVMINNAGILLAGRFEDIDVTRHLKEIDINAKGVVNGLHAAFPYLRDTANSVVVNLASASAIYGQAELANYSATKFFVRGITEALDIEWQRYGIRVIAMWPLYVQTAMTDHIKTGTTESLGIRLTAQDVADAIAKAVEPSWLRRAVHQVHFPVGSQTKAMMAGSRFSPSWLTRLVNKRLAHS